MPSQKILEKKQATVNELIEKIRSATAGVLVNYQGITVEDDTKLRAELRKAGVDYTVVKNTLTKRACEATGLSEMGQYLEGMTALAISKNDPVAPAKILKEYTDKVPTFEIKSGFLDGAVVDVKTVMELASIPPKEVLIGKLLGSIQSPLYGLCYVLQAKIDKENAAADAPAEA